MFGPTCWCPAFKTKLWIRTRGDWEDKICSNSSFYPSTSVQKTLPKCSFSCVLSVHTEKWVPRWKLASSQLQVMIRYNLYFSLMRDQDFSTFISYFHLFNYLFLGECIFFFQGHIHYKKKGSGAIWDAMLVSDIGQSSHRLLLLLLVGQCTRALLSETHLCESKNQFMLILFPSRVCSPCQWNNHCLLLFVQTAVVSWSLSHPTGVTLYMFSTEGVNSRV